MALTDSWLIQRLRALYRGVAGPEATLSAIPLALLRGLQGDLTYARVGDSIFKLDLRDTVVSFQLLFQRGYEPAQTALLKAVLRPGDHVVDAGAHVGYYAVLFGKAVQPSGAVIAIEPHEGNAALLEDNLELNGLTGSVRVVRAAAGDRAGLGMLQRVDVGNRGDSRVLAQPQVSYHKPNGRVTVGIPLVTVDECTKLWPRVDFVKMDVQGYEPFVLAGMRETMAANDDIMLVVEFWPYGLQRNGVAPADMLQTLRGHGFQLWEIPESGAVQPADDQRLVRRLDNTTGFTNLLCARSARSLSRLAAAGVLAA